VFKAYFDESWDARQEKILVFGGMIGRHEEWAKIEWPWKQLLDKYEIEYYRATEAEHARGQFKKPPFRTVPDSLTFKQNELLREVRREFFEVVTRGIVSGLAVGIPITMFSEVANTPEKLAKLGGTPYYLCGHMVILRTLKAVKYEVNSRELVTFVFDRQQTFRAEMLKVHARLATKECEFHSQVGSITFDDKRRFVPLQIADTLAYEVRKQFEREMDDSSAEVRPELKRFKASGKVFEISMCETNCLEWYLEH
jgi:hypothetical protein